MQLEDYFDFLAPNDIRIKGTRVGIETILYDFIHCNRTPEVIAQSYPTLTIEQIYATITYYFHKKEATTKYLTEWIEYSDRMWAEQNQNPSQAIQRLQKTKAQRKTKLYLKDNPLELTQISA